MKKLLCKIPLLAALILFANLAWADPIWIDVRTVEEFGEDHIEGHANIPLANIDPVQLATMYDKDAEINLYCRSGNRAGQALELLEAAGFTNVTNSGGISDVRELQALATQSSTAQ